MPNIEIPDRLCMLPGKPFFKGKKICEGLRISIDGIEQLGSVIEYCISEGWAYVLASDENNQPILNEAKDGLAHVWVKGKIKVWRE